MIVLGKIIEPYGVAGWVRVHPFADDLEAWSKLPAWWICARDDSADESVWTERGLTRARVVNGKVLAKLADVDDRTAAEALKSWFVAAPRRALPEPAADEYYWDDLLGLVVRNLEGKTLGEVTELIETGANDVLVVKSGEERRLIPFLGQVVQRVDLSRREMLVDWGADW